MLWFILELVLIHEEKETSGLCDYKEEMMNLNAYLEDKKFFILGV